MHVLTYTSWHHDVISQQNVRFKAYFLGYLTRSFIYCAIHQAQAIEPTTSKFNSSRQQVYNKLSFIIGSESWVITTTNYSRCSHVYLGVGKFHCNGMSKFLKNTQLI